MGRSQNLAEFLYALACFIAIVAASTATAAPLSFERSEILEDDGHHLRIATDGGDTWVAIWKGFATSGVRFSRSADDGRTWSPPQDLGAAIALDDLDLASDGAGGWLAIWNRYSSPDGDDVYATRSTDDGVTWSAPILVDPTPLIDGYHQRFVRLATDRAGRWIAAWQRSPDSNGRVMLSRSDDLGSTWSAPVEIGVMSGQPALATDRVGNWVLAWSTNDLLPPSQAGVYESHSSDNGTNWSPAQRIDETPSESLTTPLATDRNGTWMLAYPGKGPGNAVSELIVRRSQDGGATWTTGIYVDTNAPQPVERNTRAMEIAFNAADESWVAFWASDGVPFGVSGSYELFYARSHDSGATWTPPAAVDAEADGDGKNFIFYASAAVDESGVWVAVYGKAPWGAPTDVIGYRAASRVDCDATPRVDCAAPGSRGSSLKVTSRSGRRDNVRWKWSKAVPSDVMDFSAPTTSSPYVLCLYDSVPQPILVMEKDVAAGGSCDGSACWRAGSTSFFYRDSKRTATAVKKIDLMANANGRTKISWNSAGSSLAPPALPLAVHAGLRMQLVNRENAKCWEAHFSVLAKNESRSLKARSD